jgi:hypothetical protein
MVRPYITSRIEKTLKEDDIYEPIIDIEHNDFNLEEGGTLGYVNLFSNTGNIKEMKDDVLKVQDSSQKKLKTLQHFRKTATFEVTPFEYVI